MHRVRSCSPARIGSYTPQSLTAPTEKVTATAGPNGQLDWFNCGVDGKGWAPPYVSVSDIVTSELADAIQQDGSPFKACSQYVDTFYKYASQHGREWCFLASAPFM